MNWSSSPDRKLNDTVIPENEILVGKRRFVLKLAERVEPVRGRLPCSSEQLP
jgi:hypothetical protein